MFKNLSTFQPDASEPTTSNQAKHIPLQAYLFQPRLTQLFPLFLFPITPGPEEAALGGAD